MRNDEQPWVPAFAGRDSELQWLAGLWEKAKQGKPQIGVLTGNTGRGKTRILQQFFARLSTEEDPNHYWPDLLAAGNNLELNPPARAFEGRMARTMPWLWWSIRFDDPQASNRRETIPTLDYSAVLKMHVARVVELRSIRDAQRRRFAEALEVGTEAIPIVGSLTAAYKGIRIGAEAISDMRRKQDIEACDIDENAVRDGERLIDDLLVLLEAPLSGKVSDHPTVPVIVVLDDAHWIDPFSLVFLQRLFMRFGKPGFPLLVLATHWQKEWNRDSEVCTDDITKPQNFAQLVAVLHRHSPMACEVRGVDPLRDDAAADRSLDASLSARLPGLTPEQRSQIIVGSGGNLRLLVESVRTLLSYKDDAFESGDDQRALTDFGVLRLEEIVAETDVFAVVSRRFRNLGATARALGAGSLQGERFLPALLKEIAAELLPGEADPESALDVALRYAHRPEAFIDLEPAAGRFVETLYLRVAAEHVEKNRPLATRLRQATRATITRWLEERRWRDLEPPAAMTFLRTAENMLADDEDARAWLLAAAPLVHLINSSAAPSAAATLARAIATKASPVLLAEIAYRSTDELVEVYTVCEWLAATSRHAHAIQTLNAVVDHHRTICEQAGETPERLRDLLVLLSKVGDIELGSGTEGSVAKARAVYAESVELGRRILSEFGETPERLRNLSAVWGRVGNAQMALGTASGLISARTAFAESLGVIRRIASMQGDSPHTMQDVSFALLKLGDAEAMLDSEIMLELAREHFDESMRIINGVISQFGESPELLEHLSLSLDRLGDHAIKSNSLEGAASAEAFYLQSIETRRRILSSYGETPERLLNLSLALERLGDLVIERGTDVSASFARGRYEESLELVRRVISSFGATPDRLRALSLLLGRCGDLLCDFGNAEERQSAQALYLDALNLFRYIVSEFGERPDRLRDLSVSLHRLCALADHTADQTSACAFAHEGLSTVDRLIEMRAAFADLVELRNWFREQIDRMGCEGP